ncbi:MAG: DciA family protein [Massilia sp.]
MHIYGTKTRKTSIEVTDFLRRNDKMAALMPAVMRMASLQSDCARELPPMFGNCDVLSFEDAHLVLAVPSSAMAAKLKQQLPKLMGALHKRGWQVVDIKLKVQVTRSLAPVVHTHQLAFPGAAKAAFEELGSTLAPTEQNATLIAAIKAMAARRR